MNPDIKGRILAHIMFEELEKIAAKGSSLLKSLVKKNVKSPKGKVIQGLQPADLKPLNLDTLGRPPKVVPTSPKPSQYTPAMPERTGFKPEIDFEDLSKVDDLALMQNLDAMDPKDFGYNQIQKELQKRRNAVMKGPNRGPTRNIEEEAVARGRERAGKASTPPDILGEPLDTGDLNRVMAADAARDKAKNETFENLRNELKKDITETATPNVTPTGGTKDRAAQILDIDNEINRLQKEIDGFQSRRYNADIMGDIGPETQAAVDKKIKQLSKKMKELKSQKKGLQTTPTPTATPTPPTKASAKPKSGESNPVLDSLEEQLNIRQQQLNEKAKRVMNPDGSIKPGMDAEYQKYLKEAGTVQRSRANLEKQRKALASPPGSTKPPASDAPLTGDGTLKADGTRNPRKKKSESSKTLEPGDSTKGSTFESKPRPKRPRDVNTITDDIQAQIDAGVPDPGKLRTLQSELKAAKEGRTSYTDFTRTPAASTPASIVGSPSTAPITPRTASSYRSVDDLIADQSFALPDGVRTTIKDTGAVGGQIVNQMDAETVNFLRSQGVVVSPDLDSRALSNYAKDTSNVRNLPEGKVMGATDPGRKEVLKSLGLKREGAVIKHTESGKVVGTATDQNGIVLFDQKKISTEAALEGAFQGNVTKLESGASLKMDDLTAQAAQGNKNLNHLKEIKQGNDTFLINSNNGQVIGKKQGNTVVGVDQAEVSMLEQRFEDTQRQDLLRQITPEGSNGLYSAGQLEKMSPDQKRLIPYSEGGTGVQTIDDFKQLEQQALDAERLFNEQLNAVPYSKRSAEFKKTLKDLENTKIELRERYRDSRNKLQSDYQEIRRKQISGEIPDTNAAELEDALKYLKDKEVGFFNTTPLKGNTKGYKTPETPGSILGDSTRLGLGIGAAGLGAYALLGGSGSGGSQQDPYAQYGQY